MTTSRTINIPSKKQLERSFKFALSFWTDCLNNWYDLDATTDEVRYAFEKEYRDRLSYDGTSYVDMFFKAEGSWRYSPHLDSADREELANAVVLHRGNTPLPTYADMGGSSFNLHPAVSVKKKQTLISDYLSVNTQ
jgi:hypothetical protein